MKTPCRILLAMSLAAWPSSPQAAVFRVPSGYSTIQAALDAAVAGDTVLVAPGTYSGPGNTYLTLESKDLVIRSEAGAEQTVIDCGTQQWCAGIEFYQVTRRTLFEGFTIQDAHESFGSMYILRASPVIRNCTLEGGWGLDGAGGLTARLPGRPRIESCTMRQCLGGGILVEDGASAEIVGCNVSDNQGRGISLWGCPDVLVQDCIVERNEGGAGLDVAATGTVVVERCLFAANQDTWYGGVLGQAGHLILRDCTVASNRASGHNGAGGVAVVGPYSDLAMERCIIWGNCAPDGVDNLQAANRMTVTCCAYDSSSVMLGPFGSLTQDGPQVFEDPRFCDLAPCPDGMGGPIPSGDYRLRGDSPCLAQFSPCLQRIGLFDQGCPAPVPVGACCIGGECRLCTQAQCVQAGGSYRGDGVGCYPDPCGATATEETSWGRIKNNYRRGGRR
jgi:parallel beta-helix repeat protein